MHEVDADVNHPRTDILIPLNEQRSGLELFIDTTLYYVETLKEFSTEFKDSSAHRYLVAIIKQWWI